MNRAKRPRRKYQPFGSKRFPPPATRGMKLTLKLHINRIKLGLGPKNGPLSCVMASFWDKFTISRLRMKLPSVFSSSEN